MVQDFTDEQDVELVMKTLSNFWRDKVIKHQAKEGEQRFLGKLSGTQMGEEQLKTTLEKAFGPLRGVRKLRGVHINLFMNETQRQRALGFRSMELGGKVLSLSKTEAWFTPRRYSNSSPNNGNWSMITRCLWTR